MPVPSNGVTEEAGMPSKEELTQQPGVPRTIRDQENIQEWTDWVLNLDIWKRLGEYVE